MQNAITFVTDHLDNIFVPLCALFLLRICICAGEVRRSRRIRQQQGRLHAVGRQITEIWLFAGATLGGLVTLLLGRLWPVGAALLLALGYVGWRIGRQRGRRADDALRAQAPSAHPGETPAGPSLLVEELLRDTKEETKTERK